MITETGCDFWGWINAFSRLPMMRMMHLTSCHSDSARETIEWSMLTQVPSSYLLSFRRYGSQKKSFRKKMKMI